MRTFSIVMLSLVCALALSSSVAAQSKSEMIWGFEPGEGKVGEVVGGEVVKEHATQGQSALKVTSEGEGYPGLRITDKAVLAKFKDYVVMKVDVFNPGDEPVRYGLRVDDAASTSYGTRFNDENYLAPPGQSTLELNVTSLLRSSSKNFSARDKLDTAKLTLVSVAIMGRKGVAATLYLDNVRLETSGLPAVEGLHAFCFGPSKAAVFPGFERVNEKMPYTPERGYGWNKPESWDRVYIPDDLTAAFMRGGSFEMDLPNGSYEANVCIDPFGAWHRFPSWQWRTLTFNGKAVLDEKMDGNAFLDKLYLAHENQEDLPGQDVWNKFVAPRNIVRRYDVDVTGGKLVMKLDSDNKHGKPVCFLVVYPKAKAAEGRAWMESLETGRRERFNRGLYVIVPKDEKQGPRPAGVAGVPLFLFSRATGEDINLRDIPTVDEIGRPLMLEAAKGERSSVQLGIYAVAPMAGATVIPSEFAGPGGAKIPASAVQVRYVRNFLKHMGRMRAGTILPYILMDFDKLDLTPDVTRGIWLTVTVPETAAPGEYKGSVRVGNAAMSKAIDFQITVLAFRLEPARSITLAVTGSTAGHWYGWFPDLKERWWKNAEAVMKDLADHGMNAVTGGPAMKLNGIANGKADIDYSDADRWVELAKKYGLTMPGDSYGGFDVAGVPFNSKDLAANEKAAQAFGVTYPEMLKIVFDDVAAHAKAKGWMPRIYYFLDEPRPEFGNIESALELIKIATKASPATKFAGYYSTGQGRNPYFQTMPVSIAHWTKESAELTKNAGKELWDYDGTRARYNIGRWAFAASKAGLAGYERNGYMYVNSDPYFDFSDDEASWCVVYPSKKDSPNATVGWERTAEGANDFRYLEMLDRLIAKAAGKPEAAAAKTWLDGTLKPIDLEHKETADLSAADFDTFRRQCAMHIVALRKALNL